MAGRPALITGATGFLGRQVLHAFKRDEWIVTGTGRSRADSASTLRLDLTDAASISRVLDEVRPTVVVHCAANRFPDKCEADPEGARALNVRATADLARATTMRGILLIYISTDYVFSGKEGEAPYEVDSPTGPPNLYGQTKRDGELAMLQETEHNRLGLVLRVPVLYGPTSENSESAINVLMEVLRKAQEPGANVSVDDWAIRYPTNTEDVGRVCSDVADLYLEAGAAGRRAFPRVLHFSSEDRMTKYQVCEIFAEIMGLRMDGIKPNKTGNEPSGTQRPYDTHLSTKALEALGLPIWTQDFKAWW